MNKNSNAEPVSGSEKLYEAITGIRDDIISGAEERVIKKRSPAAAKKLLIRATAAAAALAVIVTGAIALRSKNKPAETTDANGFAASKYALAQAQYPKMAPYPDETAYIGADGIFDSDGFSVVYNAWRDSIKAQRRDRGYADGLDGFFSLSAETFLTDDSGENKVYSPANIYMALSLLAEISGGESREQILALLGCADIQDLRVQASDVWNATYRMDGAVSSVLANSVWTDNGRGYNQKVFDSIAENYYASVFNGEMGSEDYNSALRSWLNEQSGGLLEQQAGQLELSPETVLAIASAVYFRSKWNPEYNASSTVRDVFHGVSGDASADYMNMEDIGVYFWDDDFGAIYHSLESGGRMWFILPDEGISPETLIDNGGAGRILALVNNPEDRQHNSKQLLIDRYIPKFDISGRLELDAGLKQMGITDVFDPSVSDFSPLSEDCEGVFLSKAEHACRVAIDEEGVTAAAYTVMAACGACEPPDEVIEFRADRPFIFVITNPDNVPLFIGIVNNI